MLLLAVVPIRFLVPYSLHKSEPHNTENLKEHLGVVLKRLKSSWALGLFACSLVTFIVLFGTLQGYLLTFMDQSFGASPLLTTLSPSLAFFFTGQSPSSVQVHIFRH